MNKYLQITLLFPILLFITFNSCESRSKKSNIAEKTKPNREESSFNQEDKELITIVEQLLFAAGNYDLQAMDSMVSDKANLGVAIVRNGVSTNSVITISEYFERVKDRELKPYYETVNAYKILVNQGQIAFVWADATMYKFGVPRTNNIDNFTLIKENGEWKFINLSFTNTRLAEELKVYNSTVFARSYAQAWCSNRPDFVASFYTPNAVLQVNDGETAIGNEAISQVAKGFMDAFPDMVVEMDSLTTNSDKTRFYWTLTGTNTGSGGTGNQVKISGFEEWTLNENGFIQNSKGHFDANEYQHQLNIGLDK